MEINIQSLHFDASQQLIDFINKKLTKLEQYIDEPISAKVTLRVVRSDDRTNKEASVKMLVPEGELFASKQTDTFEESIVDAVDALIKQIDRYKEKKNTELTKKN
ncbi:MAG: ribosome-associated translation inhibitor RaiA [Bacteroidales bacterium]|nr:ribosome-associated translation inhibitor RaiA [Bacteroidales bacterium]